MKKNHEKTDVEKDPLSKGNNGKDSKGRFVKGWKGGPGNPTYRNAHEYRRMIYEITCEKDLKEVWAALMGKAKAGDIAAIKEVLDRLLGKVRDPDPEVIKDTFIKETYRIVNGKVEVESSPIEQ